MSVSFSMSFPDETFEEIMDHYDESSIREAKKQAKEDMKDNLLQEIQ